MVLNNKLCAVMIYLLLNDVAVFIQKGSRIVMGPDVQHTDMDMSNTTHWPA